ncbi:hypothetical protein K461DRAFT_304086 [Myriangium duriaei CBS 260.36]|uniref:Major royal jelly protein n=1 Tax=Myriangium duriaei CBS 260.36 TaxID=1168546 RepID=A0A9P4J4L4_9PEZI|nr:hypothetical protein K461DRAFT_304086 [Myriangium duriaei CBS 260.36]
MAFFVEYPNATIGVCPNDFTIIGGEPQPVHQSTNPPTGLAVDNDLNIYIAYPRNSGLTPNNVAIATSFDSEEPWPNAAIQNCSTGQDLSTCFINVQNPVLDSQGVMWVVDSGIPPGQKSPVYPGAKIMSFNITTRQMIRTYPVPSNLFYDNLNINDVRINNTLGTKGYAFMTDESKGGSIVSIDLDTGATLRRLHNTSVVMADPGYVGSYNGQPIYSWSGTNKSFTPTGSDGITLASGNVYWGVLASRRFYYVPQAAVINPALTDEQVYATVVYPGNCATEQAGFTADDKQRVYIMASEQNAIYYVDTQQSEVTEMVNGVAPGGSGPVAPENYVVKTLIRNALIQHADSAAILDGWLYFCTNQLLLGPNFQYKNIDARRGPFRTYRYWIGRGPAV